jgi:hypothetical protein
MASFYDRLYTLCGYEPEELKKQRPRIETTLKKLGLGPEDMKTAEDFVRRNHEVDLLGVRKILGIWLKGLTDLVLAKDEGKKVFYFGFPSIGGIGMAVAESSEDVYSGCPDVVLCHTLGQIFNKLNPILEAGEQNGLPAGHSLCTLQAVRVGALAKGIIPIPDMVSLSSYFCDMGSKTDELLCERYGYPSVAVDGSMDSKWGEFPDYDPMRIKYLGAQINRLFDEVEKHMGVKVDAEKFKRGLFRNADYMKAMGQLSQAMNADPLPISMATVGGLARFLGTADTRWARVEGRKAVEILIQEIQKRVEKGYGVVPKGAPRVLVGFPSFSDPGLIHMMEDAGLAVVAMTLMAPLRVKSWESDQPTLGEQRAEIEMRVGFYHSNYAIAKRWSEVCQDLKVDGFVWNYLFNCRPIASTSHLLKKVVEDETGIPVLSLEVDIYDSRYYSPSSLRTRVETFADILRSRKAAKN